MSNIPNDSQLPITIDQNKFIGVKESYFIFDINRSGQTS